MTKTKVISIDVVSDVVCPWCYIGKRRLEKGIKYIQSSDNLQVNDIKVIYRAYQLDPSVPLEGLDFQTYMENRFGNDFVAKFHQVEEAAKTEGLDSEFQPFRKPSIPSPSIAYLR